MSKLIHSAAVSLFLSLVLVSPGSSVFGQSSLPPCPPSGYFHLCYGTYTWPNGERYVGEWRDGKTNGQGTYTYANGERYVGKFRDDRRNGQGTYTWANDNRYVGEWRDGKTNGQGTFTWANGNRYVGEFRDDKSNGQGTYTWANGDRYVGEFRDDKSNGQGTITWANGDRYVGEFRDDKRTGQGTYTFANGDRYVGEYRDNKRNGQGTLIWSDGTRAAGIWSNDIFVGASNANSPSVAPSSSARVKLSGNGGTFTALILVNERLPLNFTIDSGASDVSIPADVLLTLRGIGTIQDDDFRGFETYSLADGSTVKHPTFILRSLTIGGVTVRNVLASITDVKGSPLLGQSFLKRLRSWSIDNTTNELVLVP